MATLTTLLSLVKPAGGDLVGIDVLNANMDTLDNAVLLVASQTLTNKTLTAPNMSSPTVSGGATIAGGVSMADGLTVASGGIAVTAGGLTVTTGNVGIGSGSNSAYGLLINGAGIFGSGISTYGAVINPTHAVTATTLQVGTYTQAVGAAGSYTTANQYGLEAANNAKGAGQTVISSYGITVHSQTAGGTNNYGIFVNAPSGGSSINASLVAIGEVLLGGGNGASLATNATTGFAWIPNCLGVPTGVPALIGISHFNGHTPMVFDGTNNKIYFYNGAWKSVAVA